MRYYKSMRSKTTDTHVHEELRKMTSEYPRTFILHKVTHLPGGFDSVDLIVTFSWDDVEDGWKKEEVNDKDYKNYRLDSVIPPPPYDQPYRAVFGEDRPPGEEGVPVWEPPYQSTTAV